MEQKQDNSSAPAPIAGPNVHNGTYTVTHPSFGHYTVKLYTAQKGALAGKRILALLVGPDNQNDFKPVAFWDDQKALAYPWKRFKSPVADQSFKFDGVLWDEKWTKIEKRIAIWVDLVIRGKSERGYWYQSDYRILLEGRCVVCNRPLTDPVSIETGIGPICGKRA